MVDGKLIGFSIDQAILNPDVAQKSDAETKELLRRSGVWNEVGGVDKAAMQDRLSRRVE